MCQDQRTYWSPFGGVKFHVCLFLSQDPGWRDVCQVRYSWEKMLGITAGQVWSLNHTSRHPTWRLGLSLDSNYGCLSRCFTLKLEAPFISKISTKEGNATTWSFESWSSKFWTTSNRSNSKSMRIVPAVLGQLGSNLWIMETSHCECQGQFPIWQMSPWSPSIQ